MKALNNNDFDIIDIVPIGYSNNEIINKNVIAFKLNNKDCFWFEIYGQYKIDNSIGYINKKNAKLLRFRVSTYFGRKIKYEYVVLVY